MPTNVGLSESDSECELIGRAVFKGVAVAFVQQATRWRCAPHGRASRCSGPRHGAGAESHQLFADGGSAARGEGKWPSGSSVTISW